MSKDLCIKLYRMQLCKNSVKKYVWRVVWPGTKFLSQNRGCKRSIALGGYVIIESSWTSYPMMNPHDGFPRARFSRRKRKTLQGYHYLFHFGRHGLTKATLCMGSGTGPRRFLVIAGDLSSVAGDRLHAR